MDGIKFLIDLDSKTAGAVAADTAMQRLEQGAERANKNMGEIGLNTRTFTRDIMKADFAMEVLHKGAKIVKESFEGVYELIKDTINVAADERREKMAMTNLLGGSEDAEKALEYLDRFAALSEFSAEKTKTFGLELLNAGYRGQEWKNALAAIGDAATMSSNKIEGADSALSSFMRMKETGKLDARILRGLHLNVKDVIKGLGDSLGMTPEAVQKGLMEGTIPAAKAFETVLRALEKKTGHALGENVLKSGQGLSAKIEHLKEIPRLLMESVANSPGIDKIESAFGRVIEAFDPEGPKGKEISKGLASLMGSVGDALEKTDWAALTMKLGGVATTIGTWVGPLAKAADLVVKILDTSIKIPGALSGLGEKIGDFFAERDLQWEREKARTIKNKGLVGEVTSADTVQQLAHKQWEQSEYERMLAARSEPSIDAPNASSFSSLPPMSSLANASGNGATNVSAKAEVVVNVSGAAAGTPEAIGQAAKHGVEAGMTSALEQQALHAGTRSARKRKQ
jgi:tape measure domain-containing protein